MPHEERPPAVRHDAPRFAPAVSVIIPAYKVASYIGEALDSVFAQTFSDHEVIVINDGSPDTEELESALEPYRQRIVYVRQENRGPGGARNAGIMKARGEYVALLDGDDAWKVDYLAEQMGILRENPALDLHYVDALLTGDSHLAGQTYMQTVPSHGAVTYESLLALECVVLTSCVVARRQSLVDAGLFDEKFTYSEDFDLWLRLARCGGRIAYKRRVLAHHRLHAASLTTNMARLFEGQLEVYRKHARLPDLSPRTGELIAAQMRRCSADLALERGKQQFVAGQFEQAAEDLERANSYYRSRKLRLVLLALRAAPRLLRRVYELRHRFLTHSAQTSAR